MAKRMRYKTIEKYLTYTLLADTAVFALFLLFSGLGVIAKKPDIRRKKEEDIERLPEIQAQILRESARHLKRGGTLVYSTCTLNPKENKEVVEAFLAENKDFELVPFKVGALEAPEGLKELFPHIHKTDGFFIAKLTKK